MTDRERIEQVVKDSGWVVLRGSAPSGVVYQRTPGVHLEVTYDENDNLLELNRVITMNLVPEPEQAISCIKAQPRYR